MISPSACGGRQHPQQQPWHGEVPTAQVGHERCLVIQAPCGPDLRTQGPHAASLGRWGRTMMLVRWWPSMKHSMDTMLGEEPRSTKHSFNTWCTAFVSPSLHPRACH